MKDSIDIQRIEYNIYTNIVADFSEYFNNRMNVYKSILMYLSSISKKHFLGTSSDIIYSEYVEWCKANNFVPFKQKSFARTLNTMGGFELIRECKGSGKNKIVKTYYREVIK